MKKSVRLLLKIFASTVATVVVVLVGAAVLLNSDTVQNKLMNRATVMLSEKLNTRIAIEHVNVDVLQQRLRLYGVRIDDQQQRPMLSMDRMVVGVELLPLLKRELNIADADVEGLHAQLFKEEGDSTANYQFVIDSLKSDQPHKTQGGSQMKIDLRRVSLNDIALTYNEKSVSLKKLDLSRDRQDRFVVGLAGIEAKWRVQKKKGPEDQHLFIETIGYHQEDTLHYVKIGNLHFITDNHLPRKNKARPRRGAFDPGHHNIVAQLDFCIDHLGKDTLHGALRQGLVVDTVAGINLSDLHFDIATNKRQLWISKLAVVTGNTRVDVPTATLTLPSKKEGRTFSYKASTVKGSTLLKDIAKPFAPALGRFTMPLLFSTSMSGDQNGMQFGNVRVSSKDKRLSIEATGNISNLKEGRKLKVWFKINEMKTDARKAVEIVNQFAVKKLMMEQLNRLGRIRYKGNMNVLWRYEAFNGMLYTDAGNIDLNIAVNGQTKYVEGSLRTDSVHLDRLFDTGCPCYVACAADFRFDISKERTAIMRRQKGGKLPIGSVKAIIRSARYGVVKANNIQATIVSDGAEATGEILKTGKLTDMLCTFSFTDTKSLRKIKIKPKMKIHLLEKIKRKESDEEKQKRKLEKEEKKMARKAERDAKRQVREEEKAARKAERADRKAKKKAEKEEKKRQKEKQE